MTLGTDHDLENMLKNMRLNTPDDFLELQEFMRDGRTSEVILDEYGDDAQKDEPDPSQEYEEMPQHGSVIIIRWLSVGVALLVIGSSIFMCVNS